MTTEKARKEFKLMFDETKGSEAEARHDQQLLADACIELRKALGVSRKEVGQALAQIAGADALSAVDLEQRCWTGHATLYHDAVLRIAEAKKK